MIPISALLRTSTDYLSAFGIEDPAGEARRLMAHVAGLPWSTPISEDAPLSELQEGRFKRFVSRRGEGREPYAYITHTAGFYGREFSVNPDVLIPRPSTESLVEQALSIPSRSVADIGTGSGVIAITLALHQPDLRLVATDTSTAAIAVARQNAACFGVEEQIDFRSGSCLDPLEFPVDLIVSNPPYIRRGDLAALQPEVRHEPAEALDGGPDGFDVIRILLREAPRKLNPRGALVMEIGHDQAARTVELATKAGFSNVSTHRDLDGHERVVVATL